MCCKVHVNKLHAAGNNELRIGTNQRIIHKTPFEFLFETGYDSIESSPGSEKEERDFCENIE